MPNHNQPVDPAPFKPAGIATDDDSPAPAQQQSRPRWVLPGLLALLVLAAMVVFWLPSRVTTPPRDAADSATANPDGPAATAAAPVGASRATEPGPENSPWSDAQLAKLRKEAQDVLAELLDAQFQLQERAVEQWAGEAFAAATAEATAGDELYRQREFVAAREHYETGRDAMNTLLDELPAATEAQLQRAREAIAAGDPEAAAAAVELAAIMAPDNAALAELKRRAGLLPEILPLWEEARAAEARGDLAAAEAALKRAAELDPAHQRSSRELQRVSTALVEQQFNDAMSDGYVALDESRFDNARSAFNRAGRLQPGSAEADSALAEVRAAETASRLAGLKRSGARSEQSENWSAAVKAYEQAIALDANVVFAREGLERSRSRARLDKQFQSAIDEPERLSDPSVAKATAILLAKSRSITPATPRLRRQIEALDSLLAKANTPVSVTLRSDSETEVVVYKVARLGRFEQEQLSLRPGKYTAVGSRIGYRDVRRTFVVSHDKVSEPVVIACTEPI